MIDLAKQRAALEALHVILVRTRWMAYEKEPHERIAKLMDGTEYLVALLLEPTDRTKEFRGYLQQISEEFVLCRQAFAIFEGSQEPPPST